MSQVSQTALISGGRDWSICQCTDFGSVPSRLTHERGLRFAKGLSSFEFIKS